MNYITDHSELHSITDDLWITNIRGARERSTSRFDMVVTVCQDSVADNVGCVYRQFPVADHPDATGRYGGDASYEMFREAADTVLSALREGDTVLVHCHAGINRSASVCAAALGVLTDRSYDDAIAVVRDARPIVNPHPSMERHARRFITTHRS